MVVTEPKHWKEKCTSALGLQILDCICNLNEWLMWNLELDPEILFPSAFCKCVCVWGGGVLSPDALFSKVKNRSFKPLLDYSAWKECWKPTAVTECKLENKWKLPFDAFRIIELHALADRKVISDKAAILTVLPVQQKHSKPQKPSGFEAGSTKEAFGFCE